MICDIETVKKMGRLGSSFDDIVLEKFGIYAKVKLQKWIGIDAYAIAEADGNEILEYAEAMLILYFALPAINLSVAVDGGIVQSGRIGDGSFEYLTVEQLQRKREELMQESIQILIDSGYMTEPEPYIGKAGIHHG